MDNRAARLVGFRLLSMHRCLESASEISITSDDCNVTLSTRACILAPSNPGRRLPVPSGSRIHDS